MNIKSGMRYLFEDFTTFVPNSTNVVRNEKKKKMKTFSISKRSYSSDATLLTLFVHMKIGNAEMKYIESRQIKIVSATAK